MKVLGTTKQTNVTLYLKKGAYLTTNINLRKLSTNDFAELFKSNKIPTKMWNNIIFESYTISN